MFKLIKVVVVIMLIGAVVVVFVLPGQYRKEAIARVKEVSSGTASYISDKVNTTVDEIYTPNEKLREEAALYDALYRMYEENRSLKKQLKQSNGETGQGTEINEIGEIED